VVFIAKGTWIRACFSTSCALCRPAAWKRSFSTQGLVERSVTLLPASILSSDQSAIRRCPRHAGVCRFWLELLSWFLKMRDLNFQRNPVLEMALVRFPNLARRQRKLKPPESLFGRRSSPVERAQTCLVFKFTFQCERWFPHSSISAFPRFFLPCASFY